MTIKVFNNPMYPNDTVIMARYSKHFAAILRSHADISTHLFINNLDPITVILSKNGSEQQHQHDGDHFSKFRWQIQFPCLSSDLRSFSMAERLQASSHLN
jgi:hypothetical protein